MSESEPVPALKEMFNAAQFRRIAKETSAVFPGFDSKRFLTLCLPELDKLTLIQRLRLVTTSLHATLPKDFPKALKVLERLAPRIGPGFVSLFLPDYVGQYGQKHFKISMEALKFFTTFGSAEFAIREFLKKDLSRTLNVMEKWSRDKNEDARRLASEGCRPRLPWSFRLEALIADPNPVSQILENLKCDPSLYVRKSVANHLNDITKDHPSWVLDRVISWDLKNAHTAWIARHALRTLIKRGDRKALTVIGAGAKARVKVTNFQITPLRVKLGETVSFGFQITSLSRTTQKLVVDYSVFYVKKSGSAAPKVFKLKEFTLGAAESVSILRRQVIRNFTTRTHHPGRHEIQVVINGEKFAEGFFDLSS